MKARQRVGRGQQALFKAWAWDPLRREWAARDLAELLHPQGITKGIAEITGYTERGISRWINHPERYPKLGMKVESVMARLPFFSEDLSMDSSNRVVDV